MVLDGKQPPTLLLLVEKQFLLLLLLRQEEDPVASGEEVAIRCSDLPVEKKLEEILHSYPQCKAVSMAF